VSHCVFGGLGGLGVNLTPAEPKFQVRETEGVFPFRNVRLTDAARLFCRSLYSHVIPSPFLPHPRVDEIPYVLVKLVCATEPVR